MEVKYYYAYIEYLLGDLDASYTILLEERNKLNENELAFYAKYELDNGNYDISEKYLNKIREPEKLTAPSLAQYVLTSLKLAFLSSYEDGVNAYYVNTVLLDTKFDEVRPDTAVELYIDDNIKIDKQEIEKTINHINAKHIDDTRKLMRCRLSMNMLFISYSLQFRHEQVPVYFFPDTAKSFNYSDNPGMSMLFLGTLYMYAVKVPVDSFLSGKLEAAFKVIMDKYHDIASQEDQSGNEVITEMERGLFKFCEAILWELQNSTFNPDNYAFEYFPGGIYDDCSYTDVLDLWSEVILDNYPE